jgi:hypothetical protein
LASFYWFWPVFTGFGQFLLVLASFYWFWPDFTNIYMFLQALASLNWLVCTIFGFLLALLVWAG